MYGASGTAETPCPSLASKGERPGTLMACRALEMTRHDLLLGSGMPLDALRSSCDGPIEQIPQKDVRSRACEPYNKTQKA